MVALPSLLAVWPAWRLLVMKFTPEAQVKKGLIQYLKYSSRFDQKLYFDIKNYPQGDGDFFFGGSSLVHPFSCKGWNAEGSFPNEFGQLLKRPIYNFGFCGTTSFQMVGGLRYVLKSKKPNWVIIYSGHNDFNSSIQYILNEKFFYFYKSETLLSFVEKVCDPFIDQCAGHLRWWLTSQVELRFFKLAADLGLFNLQDYDLDEWNKLIEDYFLKNIKLMIKEAKEAGAKVLIMTPIYNHDAIPVSADGSVPENYKTLLPSKKKALIAKEYFSQNIRVRPSLVEKIKKLEDVLIFDSEKIMRDKGFSLDDQNFSDFFHFNKAFHKSLASELVLFFQSKQ